MMKAMLAVLLCMQLGFAALPACACKPRIVNLLTEYSGEVFVGQAVSVTGESASGNDQKARPLKIRFKVLHWLNKGTARATVEVNGVVNSMANTDCAGQFDFYAKVGQTRVVFGHFVEDGSFQPDHFIYIKPEDKDKIPKWLYQAYFVKQSDD
jgi:hypothetical protein